MLLNARDLEAEGVVDAGVCVIGAGAAGLALAAELDAAGEDVLLLESGDENAALARGENAGYPYFPLHRARLRGIGGTRAAWLPPGDPVWPTNGGLRSRPLDPSDFRIRDHSGRLMWPFEYETLAPYYTRAHALLGLPDRPYVAGEGEPRPPDIGGAIQPALFRFADPGRIDTLAASLIASQRARVVRGATVLELVPGPGGKRSGLVRVAAAGGGVFEVRAQRVVVATGGIEAARLLLLSVAGNPDGMGNEHGHLGRWFAEHTHVEAAHLMLAPGVTPETFAAMRRTQSPAGESIGAFRLPDSERDRLGLLNAAVGMAPRHVARTTPAARMAAEFAWALRGHSLPLHSASRLWRMVQSPRDLARAARTLAPGAGDPRAMLLVLTSEQAPNPRSRVTLGHGRDALGQHVARLEWRMTSRDHASMRGTIAALGTALEAAGYGRVDSLVEQPWGFPRVYGCWHAMGTTRMSLDPRHGVVDADCRVHSMENVYVASSAVFPTGGASTVTLTIMALALRLADHLLGRPGG